VLAASIVCFGLYAGIKGAYNQNHFATRVWERNLIYLAPLFFAALALWLDRRRVNLAGLALAAGYTAYVLAKLPYTMVNQRFASDAPGMTLLSELNRDVSLTSGDARVLMLLVFAACLLLLLAPQLARLSPRFGLGLAALATVFVLGWTVAGEVSAASAARAISHSFRANIRGNPSWVDDFDHAKPAVYIAQTEQVQPDQNSEWLLEFWNRSIKQVWVIGGCICGPGPAITPDIMNPEGLINPQPGYPYAVVEPGIVPDGTLVARHSHRGGGGFRPWRLYRVHQPLRLKSTTTGLYFDGWSQEPGGAVYTRFGQGEGRLRIRISRDLAGAARSRPYHVTIRVGTIGIVHRQPVLDRVLATRRLTVGSYGELRTVWLTSSRERFRVEVTVDPPFVPANEIAGSSDSRQLGAAVSFRFYPRKAAQR
jgi:hypothetical protein